MGTPTGPSETVRLPHLELVYARQLSQHGKRGLGAGGFTPHLELIEAGKLDLAPLIAGRIGLGEVQGIFEQMDSYAATGVHAVTDFTR